MASSMRIPESIAPESKRISVPRAPTESPAIQSEPEQPPMNPLVKDMLVKKHGLSEKFSPENR